MSSGDRITADRVCDIINALRVSIKPLYVKDLSAACKIDRVIIGEVLAVLHRYEHVSRTTRGCRAGPIHTWSWTDCRRPSEEVAADVVGVLLTRAPGATDDGTLGAAMSRWVPTGIPTRASWPACHMPEGR